MELSATALSPVLSDEVVEMATVDLGASAGSVSTAVVRSRSLQWLYSTFAWPLKITSPDPTSAKGEVFDAGSAVTIKVDDSKFAGWTKLELYDGATKVGEVSQGQAEFTVKDLKVGYHAFSVLGTDGSGQIRPSNPVLVVVRSPATSP